MVEVITASGKADVPVIEDPEELVLGLQHVVGAGIREQFDDIAWLYIHDTVEQLKLLTDPDFNAMLQRIGITSADQREIDESTGPNIFPRPSSLAKIMASQRGRGGFFHRVSSLDNRRYVVAPAQLVRTRDKIKEVRLNLTRAISLDGGSLVTAMFSQGIAAELIDYRAEPPFPAYRDVSIGSFLLQNTALG